MPEAPISVVIIGINVERYIKACIDSIKRTDYPQELLEIIYVDGGSKDSSVAIAQNCPHVKVIQLQQNRPTPGRGRNAGWKIAKHALVQFLDADTTVDPFWFKQAQEQLHDRVVAVCGRRSELERRKNPYHLIGDIEWDATPGFIDAFGGDVLIKKEALEAVGGYDDSLIGGEDPDLSYRLRQNNGLLLRIDAPMTIHDLNMDSFKQYCRRAFRTGHAYAEVGLRYRKDPEKFWLKELTRIGSSTTVPWFLWTSLSLLGLPILGPLLAAALAFRPLRLVKGFQEKFHLSMKESVLYALHLSFVVYPQMAGVLDYCLRRKKKASS